MKKMSNKGFTLIELLAVITIMGILMMVAIPAVTRTIENSRRDTFVDTVGQYVNALRNALLADNIECYNVETGKWSIASASPAGTYYFPICTEGSFCGVTEGVDAKPGSDDATESNTISEDGSEDDKLIALATTNLMEQGGKSPFGNAEMRGYIYFEKKDSSADDKERTLYYAWFVDSGRHGMLTSKESSKISRTDISTKITGDEGYAVTIPAEGLLCTLR